MRKKTCPARLLIVFAIFFLACSQTAFSQETVFQITHGPYLTSVDDTKATVMLVTNRPGMAWVTIEEKEAGADTAKTFYDIEFGSKRVNETIHRVQIEGLKPGTTYCYRAFCSETLAWKGNKTNQGEPVTAKVLDKETFCFTTLLQTKETTNFVQFNDIHERPELLESLAKQSDAKNADLIFYNGDMVHGCRDLEQMFAKFQDKAIEQFAAEVPVFYARGNHETRGAFSDRLMQLFPQPNLSYYYAFRHGPVYFIVLDAGEDKPDDNVEYGGLAAFDDYRTKEAAWLEKVLASDECKNSPYRVVILHIPPFGDDWHGTGEVEKKFMPLLNQAKIAVMFSGHRHALEKFLPSGKHDTQFPVIVVDNKSCLKVGVDQAALNWKIIDGEGKTLDSGEIKKK